MLPTIGAIYAVIGQAGQNCPDCSGPMTADGKQSSNATLAHIPNKILVSISGKPIHKLEDSQYRSGLGKICKSLTFTSVAYSLLANFVYLDWSYFA